MWRNGRYVTHYSWSIHIKDNDIGQFSKIRPDGCHNFVNFMQISTQIKVSSDLFLNNALCDIR